jgi:hypothetical protein
MKHSLTRKFLSSSLLLFVTLNVTSPALAGTSDPRSKGFLDRLIPNLPSVCLPLVGCIDSGKVAEETLESLLADELRQFATANAPIAISTQTLFETDRQLPGKPFDPVLLNLEGANANAAIPPGDYLIPVQTFCLQQVAASPRGHRYLLGALGGKRTEILQAFNQAAAATQDYNITTLQSISWAIQSGTAYRDMPGEMQTAIDRLIPEHQAALNPQQDFFEKIESIWNKGSNIAGFPNFEQFLINNLDDVGKTIVNLRQVRNRVVSSASDWRNISQEFRINGGEAGADVLGTPWSQLSDHVYARFVTDGKANEMGFLMLRIVDQAAAKKSNKAPSAQPQAQSKVLPLAAILTVASRAYTVYEIYNLITGLAAVPEGNSNVQPLAMFPQSSNLSIANPSVDLGTIADAADLAAEGLERLCRGSFSRLKAMICGVSRTFRPGHSLPSLSRRPGPNQQIDGSNNGSNNGSHNGTGNPTSTPDRSPQNNPQSPNGSPNSPNDPNRRPDVPPNLPSPNSRVRISDVDLTNAPTSPDDFLHRTKSEKIRSADEVNAEMRSDGFADPYEGEVREVITTEDMVFARIYGGESRIVGGYVMRVDQVQGRTLQEIGQRFSLPPQNLSNQMALVRVPAGTRMRMGGVKPQPQWGGIDAKETQYQLIDHIPLNSFEEVPMQNWIAP